MHLSLQIMRVWIRQSTRKRLRLNDFPERLRLHCRPHSIIFTEAPLNKVEVFHPAALLSAHCNAAAPANWNISVSLLQSQLTCSHEGRSGEVVRWRGPRGTESCSNSLPSPCPAAEEKIGRQRREKSNWKTLKEVSCVCVWGNDRGESSGRAAVPAPVLFVSNLVSSVTPLEECESVWFSK